MKQNTLALCWAQCRAAVTALGGWLGYFLGGADGLLLALVAMAVLDYLTGVLCAAADSPSQNGVSALLVGVGHILDTYVAGSGAAIRTAVICFYLSNEGLSLLENAARLGLPVPERLKEALRQLHGTEQE